MLVHKHATHRLIKAFETVGPNEPIGDEALAACEAAMTRPLSFSPPGSPSLEEHRSSVYVANCGANWDKLAELNKEVAALGYGNVITTSITK